MEAIFGTVPYNCIKIAFKAIHPNGSETIFGKPVRILLDIARLDSTRTYSQSVPCVSACLSTLIYGGILKM